MKYWEREWESYPKSTPEGSGAILLCWLITLNLQETDNNHVVGLRKKMKNYYSNVTSKNLCQRNHPKCLHTQKYLSQHYL